MRTFSLYKFNTSYRRMNPIRNHLLISGLLLLNYSIAQNYQALNGSQFAGSLAASSNPAGIVHVPYAWDITPFAAQIKQSTNAFKINNNYILAPYTQT